MRGGRPWWHWRGLGARLLLSYLAVIAVGVATLWLAVDLAAPPVLDFHVRMMLAEPSMRGMAGMMGGGMPPAASDAFAGALATTFRDALTQALLVASSAALLVAIGASVFVARRVVAPIRRLARASRRLAAGHYAERVPVASDDELGDLAGSFNDLATALEATERRRMELIGDVAHELRTPIATLEGYLEGLLDGVIEPSEQTWGRLHDEASRLRRLVDDLQELSRAEARQIPLTLRLLDPAELVSETVERLRGLFAERGLALSVDAPAGLPPVLADRDRAAQVLANLLTNALRYTPAGSVSVRVQPRGEQVEFSVADTGIGIAPEHRAHLFERFFRAEKSRSRAHGGSGVGLTISRALVEAMGGKIWAESPGLGAGSTFTFTLPLARGSRQRPSPRTEPRAARAG